MYLYIYIYFTNGFIYMFGICDVCMSCLGNLTPEKVKSFTKIVTFIAIASDKVTQRGKPETLERLLRPVGVLQSTCVKLFWGFLSFLC